jgi:glucan 1,3-beta-glucosidase
MAPRESERSRNRERSHNHEKRRARKSRYETSSSQSGSQLLSADALAKLDQLNRHEPRSTEVTPKKTSKKRHRDDRVLDERPVVEKTRRKRDREIIDEKAVDYRSRRDHKRKRRREVSGVLLEEGDGQRLRGIRGGDRYDSYEKEEEYNGSTRKKKICRSPIGRNISGLTSRRDWNRSCYSIVDHNHCCCGHSQQEKKRRFKFFII